MFERDEFFTEIVKTAMPEDEKLDEFFVDYIVNNGATDPASPAVDNLILANIGENGTVTFKKSASKAWQEESTIPKKLKIGTRIKTNQLIEKSSTVSKVNTFAVVGEDGKTLVDFSTNGGKRYFCKVKDYDKNTSKYVDYYTE